MDKSPDGAENLSYPWNVLISSVLLSVLTAELFSSPVVGLATSMDTLSRELGHSVAQAEGACVVIYAINTVAEVCNTGRREGGNI